MTSTKTIAFFGPETHKLYGPIGNVAIISAEYQCSPCVSAFNHRKTTCTDNKCLKSISVEKVYETVKKNI
jgi:ADP-heptose:LPS heptosyltransferase